LFVVSHPPPHGVTYFLAGGGHKNRHWLFHPCFATRLGGVSGGRETQGWRDSSHTLMVGAGKFGSAKAADGNGDISRKAFALPVDGGAACRTEMKSYAVPAFGSPHPLPP